MKKIICIVIPCILLLVFTACGGSGNSIDNCSLRWTDDNNVGIGLTVGEGEWSDDGDAEALESCPICMWEWDMDLDEPFDDYVQNCDHWNDCVALHNNEDENLKMNIYECASQEGYRDFFSFVDNVDVQHQEANGCTFDYGWYSYDTGGSNEYYTLATYVHNDEFKKYYFIMNTGLYSEEDAESFANQIIESTAITD